MKVRKIGNILGHTGGNFAGNVYCKYGLSPTLGTMGGGNRQPMVIENKNPQLLGGIGEKNFGTQYRQGNRVYSSEITAMCITAQPLGNTRGQSYLYAVGEPKIIREEPLDREGWYRNAKEVLSTDGLCRTLNTQSNNLCTKIKEKPSMRIRKLTPLECYRLMGFDDESFKRAEEVNSNSQLYKQAGNSIVVDVLMAIFDNLLVHGQSVWLDELLEVEEDE